MINEAAMWATIKELENKVKHFDSVIVSPSYVEGALKPIIDWQQGFQTQIDVLYDSVAQIRQELAILHESNQLKRDDYIMSKTPSEHALDSVGYFKERNDVKNDDCILCSEMDKTIQKRDRQIAVYDENRKNLLGDIEKLNVRLKLMTDEVLSARKDADEYYCKLKIKTTEHEAALRNAQHYFDLYEKHKPKLFKHGTCCADES